MRFVSTFHDKLLPPIVSCRDLGYNYLTTLPADIFEGLYSLKYL